MSTVFLTGAKARRQLLALIAECRSFSCAVAWATDNDVARSMEKHAGKAERIVIGTHRFGTCPLLLRRFAAFETARVVEPTGNLFHPKLYLFHMGDDSVTAVIGSHNLTSGAFSRNVEASVMIRGTQRDPVLRDLSRFTQAAWEGAEEITTEFLADYARQHDAKKESKEDLTRFHRSRQARGGAGDEKALLDLSWRDFVRAVKNDQQHDLRGRLDLLAAARSLFEQHGSLKNMSTEDRHRIAGTEGSLARHSGPFDWGWFGAMGGFGILRSMMIADPGPLSRALDAIPLNGPVERRHYVRFVRLFRAAFENRAREGKIPSATRLLAVKRPDVFVCFNKGNSEPICDRLGVAVSAVSLANYWDLVVEAIQASRWWRAPEPAGRDENRIWRGRAALLDAIYYEPI